MIHARLPFVAEIAEPVQTDKTSITPLTLPRRVVCWAVNPKEAMMIAVWFLNE
jgi:hypothetical protein